MIIVCYGMPRSASTYVWQIAFELIHKQYHQYHIKETFPEHLRNDFNYYVHEVIPDLHKFLPKDYIYLIKTHGDFHPSIIEFEKQGLIKVICSYRNPYDLVQSWVDVVKKEKAKPKNEQRIGFAEVESLHEILNRVRRDVRICNDWLQYLENPLLFPYETTIKSHEDNISRIAKFIGIDDYDPKSLVEYFNDTSNILEFNKGIAGRGKSLNPIKHKNFILPFNNFINNYL